jgi:hypothetical protein
MTRPNPQIRYTFSDGRLTIDGLQLLLGIEDRLSRAEAKLAAIAAVAAPAGGATVDAEARARIVAILGAAG